jgi:SpoIID/LytB domain protein
VKLTLALLTTIVISSQASAAPAAEIRVRVQRAKGIIEVSGFGLRIAPPGNIVAVVLPDPAMSKARISRTKNGTWVVKWQNKTESRFDSPNITVRGQMLRLGIEPVPHDLELIPNPKSGLDAVASLGLETYLAGVLPSEMPASWPMEALKAQAVAARSFALRTAYDRRNKHYDVDSTIMDQVYKFLNEAQQHPEWKDKIARAIDQTRGQILKDDRQQILKAFYSADCGCQTEDPKFVWGKVESLQSVKDPTCGTRKTRQWDHSLSKIEVREKLVQALSLPEDTTLRTLQIAGKTPTGRVANLVASLDVNGKSQKFMMNSQEFRRIFGFEKIRSTDFRLRWLGSKMQIMGSGMGHAVGLCQTGAKALAETGMSYEDILKLYYPKVNLYRGKPSKPASRHQSSADQRFQELGRYPARSSRRWC